MNRFDIPLQERCDRLAMGIVEMLRDTVKVENNWAKSENRHRLQIADSYRLHVELVALLEKYITPV